MAIKLENKTRVDGPDSDYPYGKIRNQTSSLAGTPVNEEVYGDFHQFFAKMLAESGLTPNGLPDNAYSGFQYFQALINVANSIVSDTVKGLIGTYTPNDLIVLYGCVVAATIPGSSTITAGAIYYNGIVYKVPAATVVTTGSQTLVFKIDTSEEPNFIYLTNGLTGTGIANYNGATVKALGPLIATTIGFTAWTRVNLASLTGATLAAGTYKYKVIGKTCTLIFSIEASQITSASEVSFAIPAAITPKVNGAFTTDNFSTGMVHFQDNSYRPFIIQTDGTAFIRLASGINGYGVGFNTSSQFSILTGSVTFEVA